MKKLTASIVLILGLTTFSFQSKAANNIDLGGTEIKMENPWHTFQEVVGKYNTASGSFLNLSIAEQTQFLNAAEVMKGRILEHPRRDSEKHLNRIDVTVNVFKFVWDSKSHLETIETITEIPVAPALG